MKSWTTATGFNGVLLNRRVELSADSEATILDPMESFRTGIGIGVG